MLRFIRRALLATIFLASSTNSIQNAEQMTETRRGARPPGAGDDHFMKNLSLIGGLLGVLAERPKHSDD